MTKATNFKTSLGGSIGAGMKSVFGGANRKYYVLEHKVTTLYHKAGESQKIIVDEIELGRSSTCAVRFDDKFETVSRRHAAIVKDGEGWKLVQLSKTNSTYLNGHKVETEWYLQSGDEIQLSTNGPKLGFIIPQGAKASVGSIGLTARLSLFRQQALRPYKKALSVMATLLVLVIAGSVWFGLTTTKQLDDYKGQIADGQHTITELQEQIRQNKDAMQILNEQLVESQRVLNKKMKDYAEKIADSISHLMVVSDNSGDLSACHPYTYFIKMYKVTFDGETVVETNNWYTCGTGFMLDDGRFVTARHVSNPLLYSNSYFFDIDGNLVIANPSDVSVYSDLSWNCARNIGHDVTFYYKAISTADTLEFTDKDFTEDNSSDKMYMLSEDLRFNGEVILSAGAPIMSGALGAKDWAYFIPNVASNDGLKKDLAKSENLRQGEDLYVLGYPHGRGEGNPIMSTAKASQNGLDRDGTIMTSNTNSEGGNSGGPVFIKQGDQYSVVGIVSGTTYEKGRMVPINVIYR